ncbi:glycosyl hydrolase family 71 domain-containing protein [Trichoderma breve]|uniref:Glycosyl hydrolase family 71 domain-containing protein n=1 Tax=Trichoderma breve TaxID=2034170 RepID=A0A9W9E4E5_9HYPO|nr:glycosyl hydrolase family 71 domain-containing protein [Trichoderma breve]KAJ4856940.1 glycosyl hydrolase family 71 domain-containing protein [Trichoderma breve]
MHIRSLLKLYATAALAASSSALSVPRSSSSSLESRQNGGPLVFCHFMIGIVGNRGSAADFDADMKNAKAAGIDAFALNIGVDSYTDQQLEYAYESAANNGMKVFISFDFNWYHTDQGTQVGQMIQKYGSKPAQLLVDGKIFASSFAGDGVDSNAVRSAAGGNIFWAPNFHPQQGTNLGDVDSAFNWMAWPSDGNNKAPKPGSNVTVQDGDNTYTNALAGKPYLAPVSPWFSTHFGAEVPYSKNWVFPGDFLWFDRWTQILQLKPRFVEIITWNDYGESHYVGRLDSPHGDDGNSKWTYGMPHNGWLDMAEPFIAAYKQGSNDPAPHITEDKIVYWFRPTLSSINCDATDTTMGDADNSTGNYFKGRPDGYQTLQDKVFIVTLLKEAGTLEVTVGGNTQTFQAAAGANKFSVDMAPGPISFKVNGLSGDAGMQILDHCPCGIYNFNAFVGTIPAGVPDQLQPAGYSNIMNGLKVSTCGPTGN